MIEQGVIDQVTDRAGSRILGEGLIAGVLGPRRSGKGLWCGKMLYELHLKGMKIFHNGSLHFGEPLGRLDALVNQDPGVLSDCIVYLDELKAIMAAARTSSTFNRLVNNNFVQGGHQALSVLWNTTSDRGVDSQLLEVTDFAFFVDGLRSGAQPWTDLKGGTAADWARAHGRNPVSCPGREPPGTYDPGIVRAHQGSGLMLDCRASPHRRSIRLSCYSQQWSRLGARKIAEMIVGCAHRYYGLFDTTYKVDAMEAQLLDAAGLKERQQRVTITQLRTLIHTMVNDLGIEKCNPIDLLEYLEGTNGVVIGDTRLGRMCTTLGVPRYRRAGAGLVYNLKGFVEREKAKAEAEAERRK